MNTRSLRRTATLVAQSMDWLVLVFFLAASVPPVLIRHESLTIIRELDLLDGSWTLDAVYKAASGVWFGRDVAFTYGPLYQWLSSVPSRWIGISTGSISATSYTLPLFIIILSTFFSARLLFPEGSAWRRALLVTLAVVFWSPTEVRVSVCILGFLIFVRFAHTVAKGSSERTLLATGAAIMCATAFLLSADTGVYSVAALLLCIVTAAGVYATVPGSVAQLSKFLALTTVCFVVLVIVTNTILLSPLNFQFWRSSFAIASGYRWFEPISMLEAEEHLILETLAVGIVVFAIAWWRREPDGPRWTLRPAFLLPGFCLALVMMQSGFVRADHAHVLRCLYPMVFLCGAILIGGIGPSRVVSAATLTIVVIVTLVQAHASTLYLPNQVLTQVKQLIHPMIACPEGYQEFDHACCLPVDAQLFTKVSAYVRQHTASGEPILVFPYQNLFGVMSRRTVAGGVLQGYLADGDYLTELDLVGLRKAKPALGLYFPDGVHTVLLDGVPSLTRSPRLWFYLLRHYRSERSPESGVLGLVRDETRDQRLALAEEKMTDPLPTVWVTNSRGSIDFGSIHWPAAGADFLKFRFRVNYSYWWRMRKPSALTLVMSFADGRRKAIHFVVEPNHDSEIWVYPWDEAELGGYFSGDESRWPAGNRSPLTNLTLIVTPIDWISVVPESVSVGEVNAIRLNLN